MTKYSSTPSIELIRQCFRYDAERGVLFWNRRPIDHFRNVKAWETFNGQFAGLEAFPTIGQHGYRHGTFQYCGNYYQILLHRLIWAFHKGAWPAQQIDHIDTVRLNNRIENLREATSGQNRRNSRMQSNNRAGLKGVIGPTPSGKYVAQIRLDGRSTHIGTFDTIEDAHAAYKATAKRHFGEYARW